MNEKQFIILMGFIIIILGVLFYWYALRPSEIRKYCLNTSISDSYDRDLFWNNYRACLADKGLRE